MIKVTIFVFVLLFSLSAQASLFTVKIEQNGISNTKNFKSVMDLFDQYNNGSLDTILAGYDRHAPANGTVDFRGIMLRLNYQADNSIAFQVPTLNIDLHFSGLTQEISFEKLKEYLKSNQDGLMKDILKASVKTTPYDMVAGNPSSLMAQMTDAAFLVASKEGQVYTPVVTGGVFSMTPFVTLHSVGFRDKNKDIQTVTLPLLYTFKLFNEYALSFDLPLTYTQTDGSVGYMAQIGVSLHIPVMKDWFLVPSVRAGVAGSEDMLSGGVLYGSSLTSKKDFKLNGKNTLTLINMIGYFKDYTLDIKEYTIAYEIQNTVFKNGVTWRTKVSDRTATSLSFTDTRYTGSKLYIDAYNELSVGVTSSYPKRSFLTDISWNLSYAFGSNYNSYVAGLGLSF